MNEKQYNMRFYLLISILTLSIIMGLILVIRKPKSTLSSTPSETSLNILKESRLLGQGKGIVIVNVYGVIQFSESENIFGIQENGVDFLVEKINRYREDKNVKGMVLRINSPGGTIGAVQELYNAIVNFRESGKYVIASMGDIAASGGYYIAAACNEIFANPGTLTGSIGVYIASASLKDLFDKIGIRQNIIKSGRHKDILSPFREMTPEERNILQSVVDDSFNQFYQVVKKSRKIKEESLRVYADGRIFSGQQAKDKKLIDGLGDLATVIKILGTKIGLGEKPNILKDKVSPFERLFSKLEHPTDSLTEKVLGFYSKNNIGLYYLYIP